MDINDQTRMGGLSNEFARTPWTEIGRLRSTDTSNKRDLTGDLLRKYWKPVYCYLRHKGYKNELAKDLTQGFFQEVVLGRDLIKQADKAKGRFRTFLLFALERYLKSAHRRKTAKKRMPEGNLIPLEQVEPFDLPESASDLGDDDYFNYTWVSSLLDQMLDEVETECCTDGMTLHWQVFTERVLRPIMEETEPPPLEQICQRHDISDPAKVSNMITTVKRRFQSVLKQRLRQSVSSDADVHEELRELTQFFVKNSAR